MPEDLGRRPDALTPGDRLPTMSEMLRRLFLLAAGLALVASATRPALASVVEAMSLETLVHASEHVVVATAVAQRSRWDGPGRIVTDVTLEIETAPKGDGRRGQALEVVCLGGSVDGVGMRVEGAPRFQAGASHLVFAERHAETGYLVPSGLSQGVMRIEASGGRRVVQPGGHGLALVQRSSSGQLLRSAPAVMHPRDLEDVLVEIRALVAREGRR